MGYPCANQMVHSLHLAFAACDDSDQVRNNYLPENGYKPTSTSCPGCLRHNSEFQSAPRSVEKVSKSLSRPHVAGHSAGAECLAGNPKLPNHDRHNRFIIHQDALNHTNSITSPNSCQRLCWGTCPPGRSCSTLHNWSCTGLNSHGQWRYLGSPSNGCTLTTARVERTCTRPFATAHCLGTQRGSLFAPLFCPFGSPMPTVPGLYFSHQRFHLATHPIGKSTGTGSTTGTPQWLDTTNTDVAFGGTATAPRIAPVGYLAPAEEMVGASWINTVQAERPSSSRSRTNWLAPSRSVAG